MMAGESAERADIFTGFSSFLLYAIDIIDATPLILWRYTRRLLRLLSWFSQRRNIHWMRFSPRRRAMSEPPPLRRLSLRRCERWFFCRRFLHYWWGCRYRHADSHLRCRCHDATMKPPPHHNMPPCVYRIPPQYHLSIRHYFDILYWVVFRRHARDFADESFTIKWCRHDDERSRRRI